MITPKHRPHESSIDNLPAITVIQPFASLIAEEFKHYETRSRPIKYRGKIAIHAGVSTEYLRDSSVFEILPEGWAMEFNPPLPGLITAREFPLGMIVAVADLVECWQTNEHQLTQIRKSANVDLVLHKEVDEREYLLGDYSQGRYAWELENIRKLNNPIPCRGRQGLWYVPKDIAHALLLGIV
jgi:hypothetical protein